MPTDLKSTVIGEEAILAVFQGDFEDDPEGASEVVAHQDGLVYVTNGNLGRIDIFELGAAESDEPVKPVHFLDLTQLPDFDGVQSVAVSDNLIAVAVSVADEERGEGIVTASRGYVAFYDIETHELVEIVKVGILPDQVAFTPDGGALIVANEAEFNEDSDTNMNPPGSISVITINDAPGNSGKGPLFQHKEAKFSNINKFGEEDIRFNPNSKLGVDIEPEYSAISADGKLGYTTLQENNAIAVTDIHKGKVIDIIQLGTVDHSIVGIDPNDDGNINIATFGNLVGLRMPDALAVFEIDGDTFFATANEGDGRGDYFLEEEDQNGNDVIVGISDVGDEARIGDLIDNDGAFGAVTIDEVVWNAYTDTEKAELSRLTISTIDGDTDGDGDIDVLHAFGGRSFTIFDEDGTVVFDSGSQLAELIEEIAPERFQDDDGDTDENRSDAKGVEPEAIEIGQIGEQTLLFIGLERDSGIVIYDISDPANAEYLNYIDGFETNNLAPEVLEFVPASGDLETPVLLASYEVSGTTVAYDLGFF